MELTKIRGISVQRAEDFKKLNIFDTSDLIKHFPRAYLDLRYREMLSSAYHNDVVLTTGKVLSMPAVRYYRRGGLVRIKCQQEGLLFDVTWFNQPYVASKLKVGEEYLFYHAPKIDVALVRGTYADEKGNITFDKEPFPLETAYVAMAAKACGGTVIAQVEDIAQFGTLKAKEPQTASCIQSSFIKKTSLKTAMCRSVWASPVTV